MAHACNIAPALGLRHRLFAVSTLGLARAGRRRGPAGPKSGRPGDRERVRIREVPSQLWTVDMPRWGPGLLTWSDIWCDVENSESFRSSRDRRVSPGHRLKGASALHNYLALIFTAAGGRVVSEPGKWPVQKRSGPPMTFVMSGVLGTVLSCAALLPVRSRGALCAPLKT